MHICLQNVERRPSFRSIPERLRLSSGTAYVIPGGRKLPETSNIVPTDASINPRGTSQGCGPSNSYWRAEIQGRLVKGRQLATIASQASGCHGLCERAFRELFPGRGRCQYDESERIFVNVAAKELPNFQDGFSRFVPYMWPAADKERAKLAAAANVYIFMFDGE